MFTSSGLTSHLKQTHNPRCREIGLRHQAYMPEDPPPSDPYTFPDSPRFSGDYFADEYRPEDFPWDAVDPDQDPDLKDDSESLPPDSDVDEFDADSDPDLEDCYQDPDTMWEPPVPDAGADRTDDEDEMGWDEDPPPMPPERSTAHDALRNRYYTETFNDKYPHFRAGHCLGSDQDTNTQYQVDLLNDMNTWSPFCSRLDWEIARWAKLRGPSSTAFSELLAIDGVGNTELLHVVLDLIDACRFASVWGSRTKTLQNSTRSSTLTFQIVPNLFEKRSSLVGRHLSYTFVMLWHVFVPSMGILSLPGRLCFPLSGTISTRKRRTGSTTRCTRGTGGGVDRYVA
jgi:hypothetical protein